ncbi:recombinase family protein [Pedobacter suwonensis]|uniref:recombinase family protein n=1 Tax=Pedobacter suwonensis TaxID=332999 RepID=UPI003D068AB1
MDQNLDRQEQQLVEFGCERIFFEKVTGAKRNRPELNQLLEYLRSGDTVVVTDLTRLSRSKNLPSGVPTIPLGLITSSATTIASFFPLGI